MVMIYPVPSVCGNCIFQGLQNNFDGNNLVYQMRISLSVGMVRKKEKEKKNDD